MAKTVLVVDDQEDVRFSLEKLLKKSGYIVISAVDGDDCLKKLTEQKVDLILLDLMMPGTPVKDIIAHIQDTKIAFFTAVRMSEAEKAQFIQDNKIVYFIQKPSNNEEIVNTVKELLAD